MQFAVFFLLGEATAWVTQENPVLLKVAWDFKLLFTPVGL